MSLVKTVTNSGADIPWSDGLVKRRYEITLTDNNLVDHVSVIGPFKVLPTDTTTGAAEAEKIRLAFQEAELSNQDITPLWNDTQADYDRRSLGRAMLITDVDEFISYLPLFQAMEARSGNNKVQRSATLNLSVDGYTQLEDRFNISVGIQGGVSTMNNLVYIELPAEFE